ncbi:MAG TPA: creatininase family protein [Cyclobacteriaceae bacterium]|nr:creatininase family protein [Cyclobacteriaceae bacterium]
MNAKFLILFVSFQISILKHTFPQADRVADNSKCWRWEQMKPVDLEKALRTVPVAYLVLSPLEWHAEALAFGCDPAVGTEIAELAWKMTGGVIIPTLYIGSETEYKDWTSTGLTSYWGMEWNTKEHNPGSLYVSNHVVDLLVRDMLAAIEREGFKVCVIVSGHGATEYVRILKGFEGAYPGGDKMKVFYSNLVDKPRPEGIDFTGSGGHADFAEASVLGAVDPGLVDKSMFGNHRRDQKVGILDTNLEKIDYNKGRASINYRSERLAETVKYYLSTLK